MMKFADEATITVSSGSGGDGCVGFRREKHVPMGGPDGGDGGRGGSVVFEVRDNVRTLAQLRYQQTFKAQGGQGGMGSNRHGKAGDDVVIVVPPGTILKNADTGETIKEFVKRRERWVFMKGGNGGWGNVHYKTSVNQAPRFAQKGIPGKTVRLKVELQLMADIGFVGFPNAGKSSLLDAYTNARPKIAPYPFTTKIPNLGMLKAWDRDIVLADIPGIIEGAHDGKGLGIRFIKHISRTSALAFLVDLSDETFLDAFPVLLGELRAFSPELARKPKVVVGTKLDCEGASENLAALVASLPEERVFGISVFSGAGLDDLKKVFFDFVESAAENRGDSEPEDPFFALADSGEAESERDDHDTRDGEDS